MAKAIINKHIDSIDGVVLSKQFTSDEEMQKGELLICNDPNNPTIYIMDTNGNPKKIAGGGATGSSYDDTAIWDAVNKNTEAIGELEENGADSTIPQEIVVAGLDGQFGAGNYSNGDTIAAGTDIYTILQNILCKELYPTNVKSTKGSATAKMNNLTLSLSESGTVEVGTLVKLTKGETNGSYSTTTDSGVTGMTYGYSLTDDNTKDSSNTSLRKTCTTSVNDDNYTISGTIIEGFDADTTVYPKTNPVTQTGVGKASLEETNLGCIKEGKNKVTISAEGASYSYEIPEIDIVYYCSNLGKTNASKCTTKIDKISNVTSKATQTASTEVTGAYYYFMGYSDNISFDQFDSNSVRALNVKSDWIVLDGTTEIVADKTIETSNGKSIVIACPATYKLASINYSNNAGMVSDFTSVGEVAVKTGEIYTNYKVYVYPIENNVAVEYTNVTLVKA